MNRSTRNARRTGSTTEDALPFVYHSTFEEPGAEQLYGELRASGDGDALGHMADEETRDCAKRMHYAAWRVSLAPTPREAARWRSRYFAWRDRVILGNRKLSFRAVQKWSPPPQLAEDLAAECQIVLIKAVAAFNPWLNIRFSTYAFTCLMRALSRLSQRQAADRLTRALHLDLLPLGEPVDDAPHAAVHDEIVALEHYLRAEATLLTPREKSVLSRRYHLQDGGPKTETLEQVGRQLGLSKERVRQVQMSALKKLREALLEAASPS